MLKIGDQVEIVKYGSLIWSGLELTLKKIGDGVYDMQPELVGQRGIITGAHLTQGKPTYALAGPSKVAWYDDEQLKLIYSPQYLTNG